MRSLARRLARLPKDEDGQSLIFGVMTVFIVLFFGAMVLAVGHVTTRRIQMQYAADAAAYSSALVESESAHLIALINTAMAEVRGRALRYAVDVNSYGVLAELRDMVYGLRRGQYDALGDQLTTLENRLAELQEDEEEDHYEEVLALQRQIAELSRQRQSLADADGNPPGAQPLDPGQAEAEDVARIVGMSRADVKYEQAYELASGWIPAAEGFLRDLSRLEHTIAVLTPRLAAESAYNTARENGAQYASIFPTSRWMPRPNAFVELDVYHLGAQWWRVVGRDTTLEVQRTVPGGGGYPRCWRITWTSGAAQREGYSICQVEEHLWHIVNIETGDNIWIEQHEEMYVVTYGEQRVAIETMANGVTKLINLNGEWPHNTIFIRRSQGTLEYARYKWDTDSEQWVEPTSGDFLPLSVTSVEVDGVRVNVNLDPTFRIGGATLWITVPAQLRLPWATITLGDPLSVTATIHGVTVRVRDESFAVGRRGYTIPMERADGRWRTYYDRGEEFWWQHRLTELEQDYHWFYEYMEFGARLERESNDLRLLSHADVDLQGWSYGGGPGSQPLPAWAYQGEENPGGWLSVRSGALQKAGVEARVRLVETLWQWADADDVVMPLENLLRRFDLLAPVIIPSGAELKEATQTLIALMQSGAFGALLQEGDAAWLPRYNYFQARPCWDNLDTHVLPGHEPPAREPNGLWEFPVDADGDGIIDFVETMPCSTCGGKGYVLVEPDDVFGREGRRIRDAYHPHRTMIRDEDYQQAKLRSEHLPLVLSEEFFKYGVTVGTWHERESHFGKTGRLERPVEYLLNQPEPGMKGVFMGSGDAGGRREVLRPPWGFFAVAAARPRLNLPGQDVIHFESPQRRKEWVEWNTNNLYLPRGAPRGSYWDARLWPISEQVLDEDVIMGLDAEAENGTAWLMKRIAYGSPWGWTSEFDLQGVAEVAELLKGRLRSRLEYRQITAGPYRDQYGALRDPFVEYMARMRMGQSRRGGQFNYNELDRESVLH